MAMLTNQRVYIYIFPVIPNNDHTTLGKFLASNWTLSDRSKSSEKMTLQPTGDFCRLSHDGSFNMAAGTNGFCPIFNY